MCNNGIPTPTFFLAKRHMDNQENVYLPSPAKYIQTHPLFRSKSLYLLTATHNEFRREKEYAAGALVAQLSPSGWARMVGRSGAARRSKIYYV